MKNFNMPEIISPTLEADEMKRLYIKQIRQGCYCNENGKIEESANSLRELYVSLGGDMHKFINALNEQGAGWYIEDTYLYTKMFSCPCPMLEKTKIDSSLTWCHCTAGYGKRFLVLFLMSQWK